MTCPFLPDEELESRALELLASYERQEGAILKPPVPVELIIENVLDIVIDWAPIRVSPSAGQTLAAISMSASGRRIVMNDLERPFFDAHFGTIAFSKAHEVGHAVLHLPTGLHQQPSLWGDETSTVFCRSDLHDRREIQAERFAAYLLMPEHLIQGAIGGDAITTWHQVYRLRDLFRVSVTAMTRRLKELNLLRLDHTGQLLPSHEAATGQSRLL